MAVSNSDLICFLNVWLSYCSSIFFKHQEALWILFWTIYRIFCSFFICRLISCFFKILIISHTPLNQVNPQIFSQFVCGFVIVTLKNSGIFSTAQLWIILTSFDIQNEKKFFIPYKPFTLIIQLFILSFFKY